jgi:ankyrin repeat protein
MLQGIDPQYRKQVANVLKWLAFSIRPLYLEELAEIFILDHEKDVPFDENDRLFTAEEVLNYLPGLITKVSFTLFDYGDFRYNQNVTEIRFAHFSIKEYLSSARVAQEYLLTPEQTAHLHIAESCLAYHLQLSQSLLATEDALRQYALWDYVARYCVAHLEKVDLKSWKESVTSRASMVFAHRTKSLLNMIRICNPDSYYASNWMKTVDELASPLCYAVSMKAFQLTSLLINNGAEVNELSPAGKRGTALQEAAWKVHKAIAKLLLDNGADVNAQGGEYGNALQAAARQANQEIIKLLLDRGADVNAQGGYYGNALQATVPGANQETVQILLDNGANINAQGGYYGNALQAAAAGANQEIIQLLLDNGADVNAQGGYYGNALQAAAARANQEIIQLLLDNGADVNAQGGYYGNALQAAAARANQEIVQLLLDNGANINI